MYHPLENCNRVKLIKSKFENIENKKENGTLSRQLSDPQKRNIKRTPAFRIEINPDNTFDRNAKNNRSFYFEKVHALKNCDTQKRSVEEKESRANSLIKSQSSIDFSLLSNRFKKDSSDEQSSAKCDEQFTDTLKAALKRPLPAGPAPKKPPRTFEHSQDVPKNKSFLYQQNEKPVESVPPVEPKHDPRYMLSKLETALRNKTIKKTQNNMKDLKSTRPFVKKPEPIYAQPFSTPPNTRRTESIKNWKNESEKEKSKSLYYMSTSLLCNEEAIECLNMDENSNHKPPINGKKPSVQSDKMKQLIKTFEKEKAANHDIFYRNEETRTAPNSRDSTDSSEDFHVSVDEIVDKFQKYVKTRPKYQEPHVTTDEYLFYCCLVVGWDNEKPRIMFKYPSNVKIPESIVNLCYPEAVSGPLDISNDAQTYTLVITNDKGERFFGYCRRVIPEGSSKCIPLTYCIISKHRAPQFYKRILIELESRHGVPDRLRDKLISRLYHNKFPRPGESVKISLPNQPNDIKDFGCICANDDDKLELNFTLHHDIRYEEVDIKCLHKLPSSILLKIFASLLLERKVILISCVISKLSSCVDALQSILYPFSWPHTFIPILPECLWTIVESPTPVICGVLSIAVVNCHKIEDGIVVDLDEGIIISQEGDENRILSDCMKKAWYKGIALAKTIPPDDYGHSVYLYDAYIKIFIISLKHYKDHIVNKTFDKEAFLKNTKSKGVRRFLNWFTETHMFLSFIESVIGNPEEFSLFDRKIEMYGSNDSDVIVTKLLEWNKVLSHV